MTNVGIIGLGFMGLTHFRSYQKVPEAKIAAIADIDPRRAKGDLTGVWGNLGEGSRSQLAMDGITGLLDYRQLLAMPEVDLVDICVPTALHTSIAIEALRAGKHVLCEKPLAFTSADARLIAAAAAESRGYFMPAQCIRFWPEWAWAKEAVLDQRYGRVLSATFQRLCSMPGGDWYADGDKSGGAILDLHIHDTDFVCHLFGRPQAVSSRGYAHRTSRVDHVLTHYLYDNIPLVSAEGGWGFADGFDFAMRYRINFERATAEYDSGRPQPLVLWENGRRRAIECDASDGYVEELRYMVRCIQQQKRPDRVTATDALHSIEVIEAEQRSINNGGSLVAIASAAPA